MARYASEQNSTQLAAPSKSLRVKMRQGTGQKMTYTLQVSGEITKVPNNASKQGAGTLQGTVFDGTFDNVEYTGTITAFSVNGAAPKDVTLTGEDASLISASGGSFSVGSPESRGGSGGGNGGGSGGGNGGGSGGQKPATQPSMMASFLPPTIMGYNSAYVILGGAGLTGAALVAYSASQE
jgi:hypothetical protein